MLPLKDKLFDLTSFVQTKFTNNFIFLMSTKTKQAGQSTLSIYNPKYLQKFYSRFRNPDVAIHVTLQPERILWDFLEIKSTILTGSFENLQLVCLICEKQVGEIRSLQNLKATWRHVFETQGDTISIFEIIGTRCDLYRNRYHMK